jgi:hypothetical protein
MDVVQPKGRSELQERVRVSAIDLDNGRAQMIVMLYPSYAWEPSKDRGEGSCEGPVGRKCRGLPPTINRNNHESLSACEGIDRVRIDK